MKRNKAIAIVRARKIATWFCIICTLIAAIITTIYLVSDVKQALLGTPGAAENGYISMILAAITLSVAILMLIWYEKIF
jgi:hypothetical protein